MSTTPQVLLQRRNFRSDFMASLFKSLPAFYDVEIVCSDGIVKWSKVLLAANSPLLKKELIGDTNLINLPSVSSSTLSSMLTCTLSFGVRSDTLSVNELEVMKLLGFSGVISDSTVQINEEVEPPTDDDNEVLLLEDEQLIQKDDEEEEEERENDDEDDLTLYAENSCPICSKTFSRPGNVLAHVKAVHEKVPGKFKCDICESSFSREAHLKDHIKSHDQPSAESERYVCDECGKSFAVESYLRRHILYHKEKKEAKQCLECFQVFKGIRSLKSHVERSHVSIRCGLCSRNFLKSDFVKHMRLIHGSTDSDTCLPCYLCDKTFTTLRGLTYHSRVHHGMVNGRVDSMLFDNDKEESCPHCDKTFRTKQNLSSHVYKVHKPKPLKECEICGKVVKSLSSHNKAVHSKESSKESNETHSCLECNRHFGSPYTLHYHVKKVHKDIRKKQMCKICGKSYEFLKKHVKEAHGENRHECPECGKFFPRNYSLERHIKYVHTRVKLQCPECKLKILHLAPHLVSSHGFSPSLSRDVDARLRESTSKNVSN